MGHQGGQPKYRTRAWPTTTAGSGAPSLPVPDPHFFSGVGAISPLRYPGSKRQLVPIIESLVKANVPPPKLFVEPFVGGATASLRLVGTGAVERVLLADLDPLVASFWKTAAFDTEWLIKAMYGEEVTVERWMYWREAEVPTTEPKRRRHLALKCLFLNRTTFSGILHSRAGPIGGKKQASAHKIDCRFNLATMQKRMEAVGDLGATGRIVDVWCLDYESTLKRLREQFGHLGTSEVVLYLDPPYVDKAIKLYGESFDDDEHNRLSTTLMLCKYRWLLSYDDSPGIRSRYEVFAPTAQHAVPLRPTRLLVEHFYTAAGRAERARRDELVVTNFPKIPDDPRYRSI